MIKKFLTSVALAAFCLVAVAQSLNPMQKIENDPAVRIGTLDSGIKYYLRANKKDPKRANFHIVYDVGAVQEDDNQNGLAHFLEHMAFNGSKNFPGNSMIDYLQSIGVRFGENLNAGTGQEMTTYMVTNVPIARETVIDSLLLVLHDWAGFIDLKDKDIDEERGVIREEWRQGNNANRRVMEKQFDVLFNKSIYAKRNVIGTEEVLKSFSYDDLKSFYHKWYRPDMQAFVIVGDFDVDVVEAKLKKTMADIKEFEVKTPKNLVVIENNEKPLVGIVADPELSSTSVELAIRHQPLPEKFNNTVLSYKTRVLTLLTSYILNERLNDIKMQPNAPFLDAGAGYFNFVEPADLFDISAQSKDGEALKALEAIYTEVLRMKKGGFVASELDRAKAKIMSRYENAYKNRNDRTNGQFINMYMSNFTKNAAIPTAEAEFELQKQLLESTTLEEVNATAMAMITDANNAVLISMPQRENIPTPTEAEVLAVLEKVKNSDIKVNVEEVVARPLIATQLPGSPIVKTEKGDFETTVWTLKNGAKVVIKKTDYKADEILLSASQKGGKSLISDLGELYAADLYASLGSMSGVSDFSQTELSKVLAGKNVNLMLGVGDNTQAINGMCAPKDLETMLQLTYLKYNNPRFDEASYNTFTGQLKAVIPNLSKNPAYIAQDSLEQTLYNHSKRHPSLSLEMLEKASLAKFEALHKQLFSNVNGMVFVIIGNLDEATLKPLVEKYIGSMKSTGATSKLGDCNDYPVKGKLENVYSIKMETPKVTSNTVYSGKWSGTPSEEVAIKAISYILDIRYTKSVREEAGGTYGVRAYFDNTPVTKDYMYKIMFDTDLSKIDQLQPIIYKEINDLMSEGPSAENLSKTKENFVKKFAEVNNTNRTWLRYISDKFVWGIDNYTNYLKDVEALSAESIKKTAKSLFNQGNICTVIQKPVLAE